MIFDLSNLYFFKKPPILEIGKNVTIPVEICEFMSKLLFSNVDISYLEMNF